MSGTSAYPGGLDNLTNPNSNDPLSSPPHATQHTQLNDAVESIETALGLNPSGTDLTVAARLLRLDKTDPIASVPGLRSLGVGFGAPGDHAYHNVQDMADVIISAPAVGQSLVWNGTRWTNGSLPTVQANNPPSITETAIPNGSQGVAYTTTIHATSGLIPFTWSATGLPPGLSISTSSNNGVISGTPTQFGTYSSIIVTCTGSNGNSANRTFSMTVNGATNAQVATDRIYNPVQNLYYSTKLVATNITGTATWTSSTLPTGLTLNTSTGVISGTPTTTGTTTVAISVIDSLGVSAPVTFNIAVVARPTTFVDLAQYVGPEGGFYTNRPTVPVDPVANATAINAIAAGTALINTTPGVIMVGSPKTQPVVINGKTRNQWYLWGTTFKLAALQPPADPSTNQANSIITITSATAPELFFAIDGNARNQDPGSNPQGVAGLPTPSDPIGHPSGYYCHGIRMSACAGVIGEVYCNNIRGVTSGNNGTGTAAQTEIFGFQKLGGIVNNAIADDITIYLDTDLPQYACSGAVWQSFSTGPYTPWRARIHAANIRHGMGTYRGQFGYVKKGSTFTACGTGINTEAGINAVAGTGIQIGINDGTLNQVVVSNCTNYGMVTNGNNAPTTTGVAVPQDPNIDIINTYGLTIIDCPSAITMSGKPTGTLGAVTSKYTHTNMRVYMNTTLSKNVFKFNTYSAMANMTPPLTAADAATMSADAIYLVGCAVHRGAGVTTTNAPDFSGGSAPIAPHPSTPIPTF